jgi:hypothetical protein
MIVVFKKSAVSSPCAGLPEGDPQTPPERGTLQGPPRPHPGHSGTEHHVGWHHGVPGGRGPQPHSDVMDAVSPGELRGRTWSCTRAS